MIVDLLLNICADLRDGPGGVLDTDSFKVLEDLLVTSGYIG